MLWGFFVYYMLANGELQVEKFEFQTQTICNTARDRRAYLSDVTEVVGQCQPVGNGGN